MKWEKRGHTWKSEIIGGKNKIGQTDCCNNRFFWIIELLSSNFWQWATLLYHILGSHRGIVEDSSLFGCDLVATGEHSWTFRMNILSSSSVSCRGKVDCLSLTMRTLQSSEKPVTAYQSMRRDIGWSAAHIN